MRSRPMCLWARSGVCVASDSLTIPAAVASWIVGAIVLARRNPSRRRPLVLTACSAVAAVALVEFLSRSSGIAERGNIGLAPPTIGVTSGLHTTATTLGQMISGAWYSDAIPTVLVVLGFVSFVALIYMATRVLRRHVTDVRRLTVPEIDSPVEGVTQPGAAIP
jgi:hypothetical protein